MKAIGVIRVSTDTQQIEDQREELFNFIKSQGYDEIIPIEAVDASAVKLNDRYLYMVQSIKDTIENDKDVKAVFVWHMNRLGRNDVVLMDFKEFFIKHNIQFICKNPYLKLLNDDGSVNAGMELAYSLFSTMSKQEDEERKAKFKRAKIGKSQRGEYVGGHIIPFGYRVEGKEFVIDDEESKLVSLIFELYSTGDYSSASLAKELNERGYYIADRKVARILAYIGYTGAATGEYGTCFPPIISKELFEVCSEIRNNNKLTMRRGERIILGSRLVKCPSCGAVCTSNSKHYVCCRASHKLDCDNTFHLKQSVADELLWRIASTQHIQYLVDLNENKVDEYKKELEKVDEKISACKLKIENSTNKKGRIAENYEDGLIDKKTRDLRLSKLEDEVIFQKNYYNQLQGKREAITRLLEESNPDSVEAFTAALDTIDEEDMYDIIHKHIKSLIPRQVSYGLRDPRTHRPNGVMIEITTTLDDVYKFMYVPNKSQGHNLFYLNGKRWVPDMI